MKYNNNDLLSAVTGGTKAYTSKYDIGQKIRVIDHYGKESTGIITDAIFYGSSMTWIYMISDESGNLMGSFREDTILGAA